MKERRNEIEKREICISEDLELFTAFPKVSSLVRNFAN